MPSFGDMEWRIEGYKSTTKLFEYRIPQRELDESGLKRLLELLAARHLEPDELIPSAMGKSALLEVQSDTTRGNRLTYWVGTDPHYVAGLFRKDEAFK